MVVRFVLLFVFLVFFSVDIIALSAPRLYENQKLYDVETFQKMYKQDLNNKFYIDYMDANHKNGIQFGTLPNAIDEQIIINPNRFSEIILSPTPKVGEFENVSGWIDEGYSDETMTHHYKINPYLTDFSGDNVKITFLNSGLLFDNGEFDFVDIVMTIKDADIYMSEDNPNFSDVISGDNPASIGFNLKNRIYQNGDLRIAHYDSFQITNSKLDNLVVGFEFFYSDSYADKESRGKKIEDKTVTFIVDLLSNGGSVSFDKSEFDYMIVNDCMYAMSFESFGKCQEYSYPVQTAEHNQVNKNVYLMGRSHLDVKNSFQNIRNSRVGFYDQFGYIGFMDTWFWPAYQNVFSRIDQRTNSQVQVGFRDSDFELNLINQNKWWGYDGDSSDEVVASGSSSVYTFDSPDNSLLLTQPKLVQSGNNTIIQIPIYNYGGAQTPLNISIRFPNYRNFQKLEQENIKVISIDQKDYFDYILNNSSFVTLPDIVELEENASKETLKRWIYNRDFYLYDSLLSDRVVFNRVILENHVAIIELTIDSDYIFFENYNFELCSGFLNCARYKE